ncbi:hypothetical protein GCM10022286_05560 [Gryllotalpicola daejeonensis]|uniref:HK97 gp10 family phage protein n=1 Tax=Gryllotalpicola daejeonensis TaxID=993087 RepID=A0ABP7ZFF9_9MICO
MSDVQIIGANTPYPVKIEGLRDVQKALRNAGADLADMSDLMHSIGQIIVQDAHVPVRSGRLARTLRAGKGKTKAVVKLGSARVPYAGIIEYGWPQRHIRTGDHLNGARERDRGRIFETFETGLQKIVENNGLGS